MTTPLKVLRMGGLKKIAILWVGGPKICAILWVGGIVRHPHILSYGGNSAGGWSEENCDSADGWSDNSSVVTLPTNFLVE